MQGQGVFLVFGCLWLAPASCGQLCRMCAEVSGITSPGGWWGSGTSTEGLLRHRTRRYSPSSAAEMSRLATHPAQRCTWRRCVEALQRCGRPLGDLRRRNAGVEPGHEARMPQVVRSRGQRRCLLLVGKCVHTRSRPSSPGDAWQLSALFPCEDPPVEVIVESHMWARSSRPAASKSVSSFLSRPHGASERTGIPPCGSSSR